MRVTDDFVFFFSYKDMFSNHYRHRPFCLPRQEHLKVKFATVEHFMMYEKAMLFGDTEIAKEIAATWNPNSAKALGRKVKNFDNAVWEANREDIIVGGLFVKMLYNNDIREAAMNHHLAGRRFVEASPFDAVYGVKLAETDPLIDDPANWKGQNLLGKYWDSACASLAPRYL